jgi:hypothetical protein
MLEVEARATSHFLYQKWLLAIRVLCLLWAIVHLINAFIYNPLPGNWFRYITNLSWSGITLYFLAAVALTVYNIKSAKHSFDALFAMAATLSWLVTIGYWTLLSVDFTRQTDDRLRFRSLTPHVFNLLMMLLEIVISKNLIPTFYLLYPIAAVYLYTIYTLMLRYAFDVPFPYDFLNPLFEKAWTIAVFEIFLGVFVTITFFVSQNLCRLRDFSVRKMFPKRQSYGNASVITI